jgi:outer membrane receptor protein involved in Fe transport
MVRAMIAAVAVALMRWSPILANGDPDAGSEPGTSSVALPMSSSADLDEIVVHGIRRGDLILPTTVTSTSAYGLDLGVMDTPRNNTLLSAVQLDALNVQNPGGFSYLTSSSYTDASFGEPNVPRIRGQYADMFYNGMRDSFTLQGYGAPISFNSVESIDIVKGPASVQGGPGAGVGGEINVVTKMPSLTKFAADFNVEVDTQQRRRASADVGGPITSDLGYRVSFTEDDSGSYYYDMFFHQQALFAAVVDQVTSRYSILVTGGFENTTYRENDGVNRVNQQLIDNNTYLTGGVVGPDLGYGSVVDLTGSVPLNDRVIIDEPAGDGAHAMHVKAQIIQTFTATDNFSIVNNTFYDYLNRYNQTENYYADTAKGAFTLENKTDFKIRFGTGPVDHTIDAGFTYRYAHVLDIQDFVDQPLMTYDLSKDPNSWVAPADQQVPSGAVLFNAAFDHLQYGVPGRAGFGFENGSANSRLRDGAVFLEHHLTFSPQWSVLYGVRGDLVQLDYSDPLGGPALYNGFAQTASTAWYGLYNGNVSVIYRPSPVVSAYLTYNKAQYVQASANDGAISTWGVDPTFYLRQKTLLEEGGLKFDLFDKALFLSTAGFYQERSITTGVGGLAHSFAHIKGGEFELNYQPNAHFFATASYSYLHTTLDSPQTFYNFPAQLGVNYDGAGVSTGNPFLPNQTFQDPGVPQQLFNVLANYKHESGWGAQMNVQVTGPIDTTQSGYLSLAAIQAGFPGLPPGQLASFEADGGYYKPPVIHWQYTMNGAVIYSLQHYLVKASIYNLTNERNLTNDAPYNGDDFLTRQPPRDYDLSVSARF